LSSPLQPTARRPAAPSALLHVPAPLPTKHHPVNAEPSRSTRLLLHGTWLSVALALGGCSSVSNFFSGEKVDYKSGAQQSAGLEVPPDLTQLAREGRYQPPAPVISASEGAKPATSTPTVSASSQGVAATQIGEMRIERDGQARWLVVPMSPEKVWPQVKAFWLESGFTLSVDNAQIGVMETNWAENRAKLPQDLIRGALGKLIDGLYDTGERDLFRTRIEAGANGGSEIYITHRGLVEEFTEQQIKDQLRWIPREPDPQLEAEFLARLMVRLGSDEKVARTAVAQPATVQPARARLLEGQPTATLELDEGFDRAWRRVGLALDRTGFTVEDRNRKDGLYYVRYVNVLSPAEQGFFSRLFGTDDGAKARRYRIAVKGESDTRSLATVLDEAGNPVPGDVGQRIANVLLSDLR